MASNYSQVMAIARDEIGYLEKRTNACLEDKIANAGAGNFTKYWAVMAPSLQGQPWCQCWINYIFRAAYGEAKAKEMLYSPGGWSYYTPTCAGYFAANGAWYSSPEIGDIIYFKNSVRICHVGMVYNVDNDYVYTVEGNTSSKNNTVVPNGGGVFAKRYLKTNSSIAGYGRPKYPQYVNNPVITVTKEPVVTKNYIYGVDVSSYQGVINWTAAKSDIDFAILRTVLRDGSIDTSFERNYTGCKSADIKVGVYKFSYAMNEAESIKEAQNVLNLLKGRHLDCGVWLDLEWSTQRQLGKTAITKIAKAFLSTIEKAGYKVGIYCNKDWYENVLDTRALNYKYWIARYPKDDNGAIKESLKLDYAMIWQFSSKARVNGISGNVDKNLTEVKFWESMAGSGTYEQPQVSTPAGIEPAPAPIFNTKVVQRQLSINYGYNLSESGIFDKATKQALAKTYQKELNKFGCGLEEDGIFGKLSSAAYANIVKYQFANSVGVFTALWQMILICYGYTSVSITGIFDTETAVNTGLLQAKLKLPVNYIVDCNVVRIALS